MLSHRWVADFHVYVRFIRGLQRLGTGVRWLEIGGDEGKVRLRGVRRMEFMWVGEELELGEARVRLR